MTVKIIPVLLLHDGSPGDFLQTIAGGDLAWGPFGLPSIPVGVPGQQMFAAPVTGQATWAMPLGHQEIVPILAAVAEVPNTTVTGVATFAFDPSLLVAPSGGLVRTITFEVDLWASSGMTTEALLFNLTSGAAVAGTTFSTTNANPTRFSSGDLAVPGVLPAANNLYELRLRIAGGVPGATDRAFASGARLNVRWS